MRKVLFVITGWMLLVGLACLSQAQVPMTGAGKGAPTAASSTVTINATGTETFQNLGASLNYTGITVAAGTNSALVCVLQRASAALDVTTGVAMTWDSGGSNQSLSLLASQGQFTNAQAAQVWGYVSAGGSSLTTGNKTLAVAWTNVAADNFIACMAFDHVMQTNNAAAFPHTATALVSTSVAVTSAVGNKVIGSIGNPQGGTSLLGTSIYYDVTNGSLVNAAADYDVGASSVNVGLVSLTASQLAGVDIAHD